MTKTESIQKSIYARLCTIERKLASAKLLVGHKEHSEMLVTDPDYEIWSLVNTAHINAAQAKVAYRNKYGI